MQIPTEREILHLRLLEAIHEQGTVSIGWLRKQFDGDQDACAVWLADSKNRGLIRSNARNSPSFGLTADGTRVVEAAVANRRDRGLRKRTLRNRYLRWIDDNVDRAGSVALDAAAFLGTTYAWFEGEIYSSAEVHDTVDYLERQGLAKAAWASGHVPYRVGITHEGRECVEDYAADVAAYLQPGQASAQVFNIQANNGTFAIAAGHESTANAVSTQVDVQAALLLAQAIEDALPVLLLGEDAKKHLEDLRDTRDPGKMKRALSWFGQALTQTGTGALGGILAEMARAAM